MFGKANYRLVTLFLGVVLNFILNLGIMVALAENPDDIPTSTPNSSVSFTFPGCATEQGPASTFAACEKSVKEGDYSTPCKSAIELAKCGMDVVCSNCNKEEIGSFTETVKSVLKPICEQPKEVFSVPVCSTISWFKNHWWIGIPVVLVGIVLGIVFTVLCYRCHLRRRRYADGQDDLDDQESSDGGGGDSSKKSTSKPTGTKSTSTKPTSAKPSAKHSAKPSAKPSTKASKQSVKPSAKPSAKPSIKPSVKPSTKSKVPEKK